VVARPTVIRELNGVKLLARVVHGVAPKDLRGLIDDAKKHWLQHRGHRRRQRGGKAGLVVGVTADLTKLRCRRAGADRRRSPWQGAGGRLDSEAGGAGGVKAMARRSGDRGKDRGRCRWR
jgi:alanyl-tRNA synthetase